MNKFLIFLPTLALLLACGGPTPSADVNGDAPVAPMVNDPDVLAAASMPVGVTEPWSAVVLEYVALKDAFVASDLRTARVKSEDMAQRIAAADMSVMGAGHDAWMANVTPLARSAKAITNAGDLDAARAAFAEMTAPMVAATKVLGDGGQDLYVQYCPMAFDNAGADWVAVGSEIRNPYFGDAMLTCGKVTEEL